MVFQVLGILGVELTPAEREAINQNRAENLLAFLAYGRGLQAMDRGDFAAAAQFFNQAIQLDPGFAVARIQASAAGDMADAAGTTTTDVAAAAAAGGGTPPAPQDTPAGAGGAGVAGVLANVDQGVNPTPTAGTIDVGSTTNAGSGAQQTQKRDPVQESQGSDSVTGATTKIVIQIRRPGTEE